MHGADASYPSSWDDAHNHNPKAPVETPDAICCQHLAHHMRRSLRSIQC